MKKVLAFFLITVLLVSLCACSAYKLKGTYEWRSDALNSRSTIQFQKDEVSINIFEDGYLKYTYEGTWGLTDNVGHFYVNGDLLDFELNEDGEIEFEGLRFKKR